MAFTLSAAESRLHCYWPLPFDVRLPFRFRFSNLLISLKDSYLSLSLSFASLLRSKIAGQVPAGNVHLINMEGSSAAVASIVVYVTVSNRVPEVLALPINGGSLKYLEWIKSRTKD